MVGPGEGSTNTLAACNSFYQNKITFRRDNSSKCFATYFRRAIVYIRRFFRRCWMYKKADRKSQMLSPLLQIGEPLPGVPSPLK